MSREQKRFAKESGHATPKSFVLSRFPQAAARRERADPGLSAHSWERRAYNKWRVWSLPKGGKALGSAGTTATAWYTASRAIVRAENEAKRGMAENEAFAAFLKELRRDYSSRDALHILKLIDQMNTKDMVHFDLDEVIERIEADHEADWQANATDHDKAQRRKQK